MDIYNLFSRSSILYRIMSFFQSVNRDSSPLIIESFSMGGYPPERIATMITIEPDLISVEEMDAVSPQLYLNSPGQTGWINECILRLRIRNQADEPVSIRAIGLEKSRVNNTPQGSMLFIPQGGYPGDPWRFYINLDSAFPSITQFRLEGNRVIPTSGNNYFEEGSIEIAPKEAHNISLYFEARKMAFRCKPYFRFEHKNKSRILSIPLSRPLIVYPLETIPDNQRFRRTYATEYPWIALESDIQFSEWATEDYFLTLPEPFTQS